LEDLPVLGFVAEAKIAAFKLSSFNFMALNVQIGGKPSSSRKRRGRSQNCNTQSRSQTAAPIASERNIYYDARVRERLEKEFNRLSSALGVGQELRLMWSPGSSKELSGEVRDGFIYIYETDEDKAIQTLKHELLDYLITSKLIKPLVALINILIKSRETEIYCEKEKLVETLLKTMI
jgi:tRNA nucleotidyltransferase/poly(A) polymerase